MNEILDLKQRLLEGDFAGAMKLTTELETMARQDKINALENFLAILISRLIVIQVIDDIYRSYVNDIRNSLIEIKQRNRLGDGCYIEADLWQSHYENIPSLCGFDCCGNNGTVGKLRCGTAQRGCEF